MSNTPAYAQLLRKRHTIGDGQVSPMLIHDLIGALDVKVKNQGREQLSASERLIYAVGKLDELVGSDPGFGGYLRSPHADDWSLALDGLQQLGAAGYLALVTHAAQVVGGTVPSSKQERAAVLKSLKKEQTRLIDQLGNVWWQHNIQNASDDEDISDSPDAEPGTITLDKGNGNRAVVDLINSTSPLIAKVMGKYKSLMTDAPAMPPRERGIDMRLIDFFLAHIDGFDLPMTERDAARFEAVRAASDTLAKAGSAAKALLALCSVPDPWVFGSPCGDESVKPRRFPVRHLVGKPASASALKQLNARLGEIAAAPAAFYAEVNGALLMRDSPDIGSPAQPGPRVDTDALTTYLNSAWSDEVPGAAGFALYPIEQWEDSTESLLAWYEALLEGDPDYDPEKGEYAWLKHATSIGQVIHSADHFVLVSSGPYAGKVLFTDHETLEADVFADSFDEFIGLICGDTSWFLQRVLSDWRFFDESGEQWVPEAWMEERVLSDR